VGGGISIASLSAFQANDTNRATKAFLREHSKLFGHGAEALEQARISREFVTAHNGMRTVVWEQQVDEVPVFEALLISHTTAKGELVNIADQFIPNPQQAADRGVANRKALLANPRVPAQQAVNVAARNIGEKADTNLISLGVAGGRPEKNEKFKAPFLLGEAEAKLVWLPMDEQTLRLCWDVILTSRQRGEMFRVLVDAQTGVVQVRRCLTDYLSEATYRVFTSDSPSPFSPGYSTPLSTQPPLVSRSLVTLSAINTNASPLGWINDGGNETIGNNVDAHTDLNSDNVPDLPRPQGSPARVFDFALDLTTQNPTAYSQAAVVQLFYWNNFMHDKLYELGFTEAAGNFQGTNFGRGGFGNDAVQADAQDGSGSNNANFSAPPDGSPGRMQMFIFNGPSPQRDGDLDAEIVLHEYTHGLSNRRVGGGVGISSLQSAGMGEGWSDFYGLALLSEAGDDPNGVYAAGAYVTYLLSGMTENYYFGIRRYPYCTDLIKNPLTFKDIDPAQASVHTEIPRSSIFSTTADEVHNIGEVWCVTLWDARANLINKYGWALGNQRALQLVTDGMNLSPANPNFVQSRDAILQADLVNGGADRGQLWVAFAKRGLGLSATSPGSSTTSGLVEAYDLPDDLQISPAVLSSTGPVGGPFTPNPAFFTVSNVGTNALNWSLTHSSVWLTVSPTNGTLAGGASTTVSVLVSAIVTNFPLGSTSSIISFSNQASGVAQSRTFSLSVFGRTLFENFEPDIHLALWSGFGGTLGSTVIATNYGDSISPVNSLWFGDGGTRSATTIPVNTSAGGSISFYLRLGNGSFPWEMVDIPAEGIVLEYSTNSGASWNIMGTYDTSTYYNWTQVTTNIPIGALSSATQFRWRQLNHSGTCCDHWALDDISIDAGPTPPFIQTQPLSQTVKSGSNVTFTISAQGSFPLSFQWYKDGTNVLNGGRISGATTSTLNLSTVVESDSGQYSVLITNMYGTLMSSNVTLLVTPLNHFEWGGISSPQVVGTPFSATITARDYLNDVVSNFNGAVSLSGSAGGVPATNVILGNLIHDSTGSALYTLGFAFTPSTNIVVTHVRSYSGTKVSIWQANGTLLASQNVSSVPGTWVETALSAPLTLSAGSSYVVGFYTAGGTYYMRSDRTNAFPNGTIENAYYYIASDGFPSTVFVSQTVFLVDLRYTVGTGLPIPLTPTSTGTFTNGVWSGMLTIQGPATNTILRADEAGGHSGLSNPFNVLLQNDLSISMADSPDPVAVGANLNYTLTVANPGPSGSTGVTVTNTLSPGVAFVSAISSQGSCTQFAGIVTCNLGSIQGGTNVSISIVVVPNSVGTITNTATVSRAEADPFLPNNSATSVSTVLMPSLSVADASIFENNGAPTNMVFTVQLSPASPLTVSVNYGTGNGTAQAGSDYVSTNGTLTFTPGETNRLVTVGVIGDTNSESTETFFLNLSAPTNASLGRAQAVGTIFDDDSITVAVFDNPVYVDTTSGGVSAESDNVQASLTNRGFRVITFTDITTAASANAVLLFPEFENRSLAQDLTSAERGALSNFVAHGGLLIVNGQGQNVGTLINSVFGFSVVEATWSAVCTRTASAAGTHFADDPVSITVNNAQFALGISSLPPGSLSIYENGGQSVVAEIPFGGGKIIYLGWDWYDAVPIGAQNGGWLTVLESAVLELGPTPLGIGTQPVSQTVKSGSNVTFTVVAQGAFPLVYQWRKDGTNLSNGGRISGATSSALNISTVLESDSGQYSVVVTNSSGSVTSSNATLLVTPLDHFEWSVISSPQSVGTPFGASITAKDFLNTTVTNFNGVVNLSGSSNATTTTILPAPGHIFSNSGNFTLGYSFTPNTNMTVTHVRHYFGTKVSIWTDAGVLLAAQNVTSTPGTWTETALSTPIQLTAGVTYRVAAYTAGGLYYGRNGLSGIFPNGTINLGYENSGDAFPVTTDSINWWFVDLRYTVGPGVAVLLSPTSTGAFTNGVWSGLLTIQAPATNMVLRAEEAGGHSGTSNPFNVLLQNDMSIDMADSPDPVAVGANLIYTLTVTNVGPSGATAVTVTNILSPGVAFVSATSSQGSCTQSAGVVTCNLGNMSGGANATVTVITVPTFAGVLTNTATVSRAEADPYLPNNTAIVTTVAQVPSISISDFTLLEGNFGTTNASLTVSLSITGALSVSINYITTNGTALAGSDYVSTNGTLTFGPGQTNKTIVVAVKGDTTGEPNETFFVNLSAATNATVAVGQGMIKILNDDVPPAAYVRSSVSAPWGSTANETAMNRVFGTSNWQDLRYETLSVGVLFSAATTFIYLEGSDFNATQLEAFLIANMAALQNWVSNGGSLFLNAAPNEDNGMDFGFGVFLTFPDTTATGGAAVPMHAIFNGPFTPVGNTWTGNSFGHATVSGTNLTGLITNNGNAHIVLGEKSYGRGHVLLGGMTTDNFHTPQPEASNLRANIIAYLNALSAYHFEWSSISGPKQFNVPFPVIITARDLTNGIVNTFNGAVGLSAISGGSNSVSITPTSSGNFTNGVWSGSITVQQPVPNVVLSANDGSGHSGDSNPFEVIATNDVSLKLVDFPDPVSVGTNLIYTLSVTNTGPGAATSVMVTNMLPANVTFVSAVASQGACTQSAGIVTCALGTIAGGTNATISIVVVPTIAGTSITNSASLSRGEADGYPANNSATEVTVVTTPAISIADGAIAEGDANSTNMFFGVTLAAPSAQAITVTYSTGDGTAAAGSDYLGTNGSLTFPPGSTNLTVKVIVLGDKLIESNETFVVNLSNPMNGVLGRSQAVGTIINDDGLPGYLDHFVWNTIPSPQAAAVPFSASITAKDFLNATVTNFNGTVALTGSAAGELATNSILAAPAYTGSGSGNYTLGYSFTPNTNITVTHVRHYYGTKVSIWTDGGVLLAAQNVTSTPGTWTETALTTPIQLSAGITYRVAAHSGGGLYYYRTDLGSTFPNGVMNAAYEVFGDAFPTNSDFVQWWFVDLRYTVGSSVPAPITPAVSGSFTNGIWSGNVTVQLLATNVVLLADDGGGHVGGSNPFDLVVQNDLSVSVSDLPDPVSVGANLTYTLSITNTGPTPATSVVLTNFLPANATFSSAAVSQGTYTQSAGVVVCDLGTVPGATNASVSIVVVPAISGVVLTNRAVISRAEPESYLSNNIAIASTTVTPPAISVADAAVIEGNVGTINMVFAVSLAVASGQTITVDYATANGTAIAGSDYTATNGTVTFTPGITNQTVVVRLNSDTLIEGNETLFVNLSNPANGVLGRSQGIGTISNDDGLPGQVDHFAWQPISSSQLINSLFATTITALDASNVLVTNFNGVVNLTAPQGGGTVPITPSISGAFTNGVWGGSIAVQSFATNLVLRADDGDGHFGLSNPFHVIGSNQPPVILTSPTNALAYLGGSASFQVNALGTDPMRYQWRTNGADIPGATNASLMLDRVLLNQAASYSVVVWNNYGTNSSGKATLTVQQVVAWGAGTNNTGVNFNYNQSVIPAGATNALKVAGGLYHSLLLRGDAKILAWGAGTGATIVNPHYRQSIVPALGSAVDVAAGGYHSLALRGDGTLVAWGAGTNNTLSQPNYGQSIIPTAVSNTVAVAAGDYHSVALRNDGRVWVWGYNGFSQTNVPAAATSNVVAVASRGSHVLALKLDGSLVHWGSPSSLPVGVSNIITIAAGVSHCLALKSDGTLVSWGSQTTVPVGLSNVVEIAAGADHNLALRRDGSVVTWGATNLYGRYQLPSGLSNFVGIACGNYHSLALLGDGSLLIKRQPVSTSALLSSPASFFVFAVGSHLEYQWQLSGTNIPGATNSSLTIQSAQALDAGNYQVVLSNIFGAVTSAVASLTVLAPIGPSVDATNLAWGTSGNAAWFGQTSISHDGIDAAQSGHITDSQQSTIQANVTGPGVLSFWWKVSSEQFFDYLYFFIDGVQQAGVSGQVDWQPQIFAVGSGVHTLKWTYQKDSSVSAGLDAGWLDQVLYTTNPPVITLQPIGQTNSMGATFSLNVSASGAPPISYQWLKDGTNVSGALSAAFNFVNATRRDSATYSVVASNPGGATLSSNAVILIRVPQRLNALVQPNGSFALSSGDADGGPLSIQDVGKFESQASSNLVDWVPLTNNMILTNGTLLIIDQDATNFPVRFYRIVEH